MLPILLNSSLATASPTSHVQSMKMMLCADFPVGGGPRVLEDLNVLDKQEEFPSLIM